MEKQIAYCGLVCTECPTFIATKNDDDDKRRETAELWSKKYNVDIKPEHINCEGCLSETPNVFSHCNVCEVRKCGQEKELPTVPIAATMSAMNWVDISRWHR